MLIDHVGLDGHRLAGEVAVVTGAGRGIGRETARGLARLGVKVVIAEVEESGRETEQLIRERGGEALFVACDVSSVASMTHMAEQAVAAFGRVDILVNNAISLTVAPLLEHTPEAWDRVVAVNLRGAFLGIKAFLPGMLARRHGTVVTMESADGMPFIAPYLATKAGLRSLALSLAHEVGEESGVAVYCFGPGIVDTPGLMDAFRELAPRYEQSFEEFVAQSGLPLISAELSATGLIGTLLDAPAFNGQETTYVAGLARLHLGPDGEPVAEPGDERPDPVAPAAQPEPAAGDAARLNRAIEDLLRLYAREFSELNLLMRPVAKRMFRQDTGQTVEEWLRTAEAMTRDLERGLGHVGRGAYLEQLRALGEHIAKQEASVPAWIKDPAAREVALASLRERRATVEAVRAGLAPPPPGPSAASAHRAT